MSPQLLLTLCVPTAMEQCLAQERLVKVSATTEVWPLNLVAKCGSLLYYF